MSLTYDIYPKVLKAIELLSQGRSKTQACDKSFLTVVQFDEACAKDTSLQRLLIEAEQRGYDAMADALLTISQNIPGAVYQETNPQMAKVVSDNIKWVLDKRDRKRFGAHVEIKHEITADAAIVAALSAAKRRAQSGGIVDLEPEDYSVNPAQMLIGQAIESFVLSDDDLIMQELLG